MTNPTAEQKRKDSGKSLTALTLLLRQEEGKRLRQAWKMEKLIDVKN